MQAVIDLHALILQAFRRRNLPAEKQLRKQSQPGRAFAQQEQQPQRYAAGNQQHQHCHAGSRQPLSQLGFGKDSAEDGLQPGNKASDSADKVREPMGVTNEQVQQKTADQGS